MSFFSTILAKIFRHKVLAGILTVLILGGGYYAYHSAKAKQTSVSYLTAKVTRGTLTTAVSGTGQVAALNQVDIKPQGSGAVVSVNVKVGDAVKQGQTLLTLDEQSAAVQITQARASVSQAQANYDKVVAGATSNDIASAQISVQAAEKSLANAQITASSSVATAQSALDNAKHNYDLVVQQQNVAVGNAHASLLNAGLVAQANDTNSTATVTLSGSYTGTQEGQYNISVYNTGLGQYYTVTGLASGNDKLTPGLPLSIGNGLYVTFSATGIINQNSTWTVLVPNIKSTSYIAAYNSYQTALQNQPQAITQAQNSIDSATQTFNASKVQAQSQIDSAQNALTQAQLTLNTKLTPAARADVETAQAQLDSARAGLASAANTYNNNVIKAPFDGVVATVNSKKGDQASSAAALVTIITPQQIAQLSLNEVDAAKIKLGQKATLTFPAISDLSISGQVGQVDQIGTVTQNVVNFSVKILFDTQDVRVKPGMSVAASIITDLKQDVLSVPSAAVKTNNGQTYVQVLSNNQPQLVAVTTGISSDTQTEISGDGIKEGDSVVTQTITKTAAKTTTPSTSNSLIPGLGGNRTGGGNFGGGTRGGGG